MKLTKKALLVIWAIMLVSFLLGISLPIATVSKLYFSKNNFSIISSLFDMVSHGGIDNIVIFLLIFLFSIVFPLFKFFVTFMQIRYCDGVWQNKYTHLIETIGHFSMIDIFMIALMVLLLKLRILVNVKIHQGFYWFSAAIIISLVLSLILKNKRNNLQKQQQSNT